ncbi:dehydrogenase [Hyaloraphidium curvatum]|nr:dehydrogenase [Hyaloraphidium curvatum]
MINKSTGLGRVSLITGGASPVGIGAATARVFAREGAKVIISDLADREQDAKKVVAECNAIRPNSAVFIPLDVTDERDWVRAMEEVEAKVGVLDVLFNNAGISGEINQLPNETMDTADISHYEKIMRINSTGVVLGLKYAAKSMKKNKVEEWKSIVMTSSVAGLQGSPAVPLGYTASKWAVRGLAKHAAQLGVADKIRCNSIHPGVIVSDMTHKPGVGEMFQQQIPFKRPGWPDEVAAAVLFLASPESSYISGQATVIDGAIHNGS